MNDLEKPQLIITNIFEKGLPTQVAQGKLCTMLDLMDLASQAADKQEGLVPKPKEIVEMEFEIITPSKPVVVCSDIPPALVGGIAKLSNHFSDLIQKKHPSFGS